MIARVWRGLTRKSEADEYLAYLMKSGVKEYRATQGNRGLCVLRRSDEDRAEFLLISFWESFEAIRKFSGSQPL